jgi:hypothetical protein
VKKSKKAFDKATQKLCSAQDRLINTNGKKEDSIIELGRLFTPSFYSNHNDFKKPLNLKF